MRVSLLCKASDSWNLVLHSSTKYTEYILLQVIVSVKESAEGHREMKEFVRKTGISLVKEKLAQYIKELKEGISLFLILDINLLCFLL